VDIHQRLKQTYEALRDHKGQFGPYCSNPDERLSHKQLTAINDALDALRAVIDARVDCSDSEPEPEELCSGCGGCEGCLGRGLMEGDDGPGSLDGAPWAALLDPYAGGRWWKQSPS
jgi:hypothetical protein